MADTRETTGEDGVFQGIILSVYDTCSQEGIYWPVGSDSQNLSKDILY